MKILHISTSDLIGGAAKACYNIDSALRLIGIDSKILVQQKVSSDEFVVPAKSGFLSQIIIKARILIDYLLIRFLTVKSRGRFTFPFIGDQIHNHPLVKNADIIHLHWIFAGFISLKSLKRLFELKKPIVWTFHDMWVFTGGCHYTAGCTNFLNECGNCPSLIFKGKKDLSNRIFLQKEKIFGNQQFSIITCSNWLGEESKRSMLLNSFKTDIIPNPIDTDLFKPHDKNQVREELNLPTNKIIFLFSAYTTSEVRKGLSYLSESLLELYKLRPELSNSIEVIIMGSANNNETEGIPFKVISLGRLENTNKVVQYYNSADLFIAPSVQENLSNTVMESLACGTPVLAFNIGGMPDMIDHLENGYLASELNSKKLLDGFLWFLELDLDSRVELSKNSRAKVLSNFTMSIVAEKYAEYYKQLLNSE